MFGIAATAGQIAADVVLFDTPSSVGIVVPTTHKPTYQTPLVGIVYAAVIVKVRTVLLAHVALVLSADNATDVETGTLLVGLSAGYEFADHNPAQQ